MLVIVAERGFSTHRTGPTAPIMRAALLTLTGLPEALQAEAIAPQASFAAANSRNQASDRGLARRDQ